MFQLTFDGAMIMEQNLEKVKSLYNAVAKEYAITFSNEYIKKSKGQEILRRFSRQLNGRRPVWDFGCGPGHLTGHLKKLGLEISGLDLSEKMLELATAIYPNIHFQRGNILNLEFKNDVIAGVVAFYTMVHFTKQQVGTAFREIFRVLQPNGLFLFTCHIGGKKVRLRRFFGKKAELDFMFFTTDFIWNALRNSGFEKIELIRTEPYPEPGYNSRRIYGFAEKPVTEKSL